MKISIRVVISCFIALVPLVLSAKESKADAALDSLDYYVEHQADYQEAKEKALAAYKRKMLKTPFEQRLPMIEYLANEYRYTNIDSAFVYNEMGANLARQLGDKKYLQRFEILACTVLPVYGVVKEAIDRFEMINPDSLIGDNRRFYYIAADLIYNYAKDFYPLDEYKLAYKAKAEVAVDSLLNLLPKSTPEYEFYEATDKLNSGGGLSAVHGLEKLLERLTFDNHLYARTAAIIGYEYVNDPYHTDDAIYYLARSAMSDIATGNRETTSLHRLGRLLYAKEDIDRAYNYLTLSLASAVASGSRLRSLEIAEALPIVFKTVGERDRRARHDLVLAICVLSLLLLTSVVLFFIYDRNRRKLKKMKEHLTESLILKDSYIRQILSLCGVYLTALENFNHVAGRKIKAGQVQDLLNMIESGRILRDQLQTFYEVFDSAFLMVYPKFVKEVNALLQPEKQVVIKEGEKMSPELRILAFMRLGLDDSTQISKFLGLSLNTVYTYRNKMKTRALDREHFEEQVKDIGNIS